MIDIKSLLIRTLKHQRYTIDAGFCLGSGNVSKLILMLAVKLIDVLELMDFHNKIGQDYKHSVPAGRSEIGKITFGYRVVRV